MILGILQLTHNATTLLFGVYLSAAFLGIVMKRSNILAVTWIFLCNRAALSRCVSNLRRSHDEGTLSFDCTSAFDSLTGLIL